MCRCNIPHELQKLITKKNGTPNSLDEQKVTIIVNENNIPTIVKKAEVPK